MFPLAKQHSITDHMTEIISSAAVRTSNHAASAQIYQATCCTCGLRIWRFSLCCGMCKT